MIILGAGLSGLLAARRLQQFNPVIMEKQSELPNNHSALLRFRSDEVADATGLSFKPVMVYKAVLLEDGTITNTPTIREFNAYSIKATEQVSERSIIDLTPRWRYIAPPNLVSLLAKDQKIQYNTDAKDFIRSNLNAHFPILSTIPMPELMVILEYPRSIPFQYKTIWTINIELIGVDVYQTLYCPYNVAMPYRVSITGSKMTLEFAEEPADTWKDVVEYYMDLMLPGWYHAQVGYQNITMKEQNYGKIIPVSNIERENFILWATDNYNIYSLGRYATWRQILLDDLVKDLRLISGYLTMRNNYDRRKGIQL